MLKSGFNRYGFVFAFSFFVTMAILKSVGHVRVVRGVDGDLTEGVPLSTKTLNTPSVKRRQYLRILSVGSAGAVTGLSAPVGASSESGFFDEIGYTITGISDDLSVDELEEVMHDSLGLVCYAREQAIDINFEWVDYEAGFLDKFREIVWAELGENPEAYNWFLDYIDKVVYLIQQLDIFSETVGDLIAEVADKARGARKLTKFIPLVWNLKRVFDTGCTIHNTIEAGKEVDKTRYITFFKRVALTVVEIVLIATGVGGGYKVAFRSTATANRVLIGVVGREIGWRAYAGVLSMIHWTVRIIFADQFGQAIEETTGVVAEQLVEASPYSQQRAQRVARTEVIKAAEAADGGLFDFDHELWELQKSINHVQEQYFQTEL